MANETASAPSPNGTPVTVTPKAGLEDIIAGESKICFLDGKRGILAYYGYNIHDLVKGSFEEKKKRPIYCSMANCLLPVNLLILQPGLSKQENFPKQIKERIASYPKNVHPMAVIRTVVSELSFYDNSAEDHSRDANIEKGIRLMSQIPLVVASYDAHRQWKADAGIEA